MESFARIFNGFQLLTILTNPSVLDVCSVSLLLFLEHPCWKPFLGLLYATSNNKGMQQAFLQQRFGSV